jgi:hypothetical protein
MKDKGWAISIKEKLYYLIDEDLATFKDPVAIFPEGNTTSKWNTAYLSGSVLFYLKGLEI